MSASAKLTKYVNRYDVITYCSLQLLHYAMPQFTQNTITGDHLLISQFPSIELCFTTYLLCRSVQKYAQKVIQNDILSF